MLQKGLLIAALALTVTSVGALGVSASDTATNREEIIKYEDEIQRDFPLDEVGSGSLEEINAYFAKVDKENKDNPEYKQLLEDFEVNTEAE